MTEKATMNIPYVPSMKQEKQITHHVRMPVRFSDTVSRKVLFESVMVYVSIDYHQLQHVKSAIWPTDI
jgi:hypothetical protein